MKALAFVSRGAAEVLDVPEPVAMPGQAVLRVLRAGICGVDVAGFRGHMPAADSLQVPGHEAVGVVESLPPGQWPISVGDRVVADLFRPCRQCPACMAGFTNQCDAWRMAGVAGEPGAMAERLAVPAGDLLAVPEGLPDDHAILTEPLANTVHLLMRVNDAVSGFVAVFGAGLQGTMLLQMIGSAGSASIAVVEPDAERRAAALAYGAALAIDPAEDDPVAAIRAWAGSGVHLSIDAAGTPSARAACLLCAQAGGMALLLGLRGAPSPIDLGDVVRREVCVLGSFGYTRADFARALDLLAAGAVSLQGRVQVAPLERGADEIRAAARGGGAILKRTLVP